MYLSYFYKISNTVKMLLKQVGPSNIANTYPCLWWRAVLNILKYVIGHNHIPKKSCHIHNKQENCVQTHK
jgi:hypothetical protein